MINAFNIQQISTISFGAGIRHKLGESLIHRHVKKALIITDGLLSSMGIIDDIVNSVESAGIDVCIFDGAKAENPAPIVEECAEFAKKQKVDAFIGIGGGSALDLAKAARILMSNPAPIKQYFDMRKPRIPSSLPLILIPTTSGTSSEVSHGAMVYDVDHHSKHGLVGQDVAATWSYIDPELFIGMPRRITAATGIDCLCHATEALTSGINENPLTDILAQHAIHLINNYILKAVENGNDLEARNMMAESCVWAGIAFDNAPPHFAHAIGHTMGALHHIPHGEACGSVLPSVIGWAARSKPEKVKMIAKSLGLTIDNSATSDEIGKQVGNTIRELYLSIGCRPINELINEEDIEKIAEEAMKDPTCFCTPDPVSPHIAEEIMRNEFMLQSKK